MSKNALLVCANSAFQPGMNAMINAIDYYGSDIDLHVVVDPNLPAEYLDSLRNNNLNYNLIVRTLDEVIESMEFVYPNYWQNEFQKWAYFRYFYIAYYMTDNYDAVGMLDGDQIIVNDLTKWFQMVGQTDFMITGFHAFHTVEMEEYCSTVMSNYEKDIGYKYRIEPLFNQPLICNPKLWAPFFKSLLDRLYETHEQDMDCVNKTLYYENLFRSVIALSPDAWIGNCVWHSQIASKTILGKSIFFTLPAHERINTIHGKWYCPGFCQAQHRTHTGDKKMVEANIDKVFGFYIKMNTGHKIIWDMPLNWR